MAFKDIILAVTMAVKKAKAYTDSKTSGLGGGVNYKGSVDYYSNLPANPEEGDAYTVKYAGSSGTVADGTEYVWGLNTDTSTMEWIEWSKDSYTKAETDNLLNGKQPTVDTTHKLSADLVDDSSSTNKFTTAADNAKMARVIMDGTETQNYYFQNSTPTNPNNGDFWFNDDPLVASDISAMTGYEKAQSASAITTSDTLNEAVGKLEKKADDNASSLSNKIGASDYASQNTGGTVRVWTTTDGTDTILHISNEAPTP